MRAVLGLILASCGGPAGEPPMDFGGFCQDFAEEGPDVDHVELYRGEVFPNFDDEPAVMVIIDEADYSNQLARWQITTAPVDFDEQQVIVVWAGAASTCGLVEDRVRVMRIDGVVVVDLTVEDTSGACEAACDLDGAMGIIVALPKSERARGCARVRNTCPE
jgi:hypothetical protein